jgi:hypothetical protein
MGNASFCNCKNRDNTFEMQITKEAKPKLAKSALKTPNPHIDESQRSNIIGIGDSSFLSDNERSKINYIYRKNSVKRIQKSFRKFAQDNSHEKSKSRDADTTSNLQCSLIKVKQSFHSPSRRFYDNSNTINKSKSLILNVNDESITYSQSKNFIHKKSVDLINLSLISDDKIKINVNDENQIANFIGNKVNGCKEGFGIEVWKNGSKFKGFFESNKVCGWGFYTHADGDVFTGQFVNDHSQGFGIFRNPNGANYVGFWMDNNQHGFGKYFFIYL